MSRSAAQRDAVRVEVEGKGSFGGRGETAQAVQLKLRVAVQCHHNADIRTVIGSTDSPQLIIVPSIAAASGAKNWSCP